MPEFDDAKITRKGLIDGLNEDLSRELFAVSALEAN